MSVIICLCLAKYNDVSIIMLSRRITQTCGLYNPPTIPMPLHLLLTRAEASTLFLTITGLKERLVKFMVTMLWPSNCLLHARGVVIFCTSTDCWVLNSSAVIH